MNTLFNIKTSILVVVMLVLPMAQAATMTKAEYQAGKTRISADVKADKAACVLLADNAKDICIEEAKAKEKAARAELKYGYTAKSSDRNKVLVAKAEAGYAVAKEKCDDQSGNVPRTCASRRPRLSRPRRWPTPRWARKSARAKVDASQAKRDADYKVATEKCDSMSGDAKASCAAAAKTKFGKS